MYRIIRKGELPVSRWSGGTTTQLAIWPEGAVYAERNFVWRVSSARVETQESEFTSLPGVARCLMVLDGTLHLEHEGRYETELVQFAQDNFSGSWTTRSRGRVTDFNLMTTAGEGRVQLLELGASSRREVELMPVVEAWRGVSEVFYLLADGILLVLPDGTEHKVSAGDVLVVHREEHGEVPVLVMENRLPQQRSDGESLGFSVLGPLAAAFCQWLHARRAARPEARRYFLARDMYLMRDVYHTLYPQEETGYLQVSRRSLAPAFLAAGDWATVLAALPRQTLTGAQIAEYCGTTCPPELADRQFDLKRPDREALHAFFRQLPRPDAAAAVTAYLSAQGICPGDFLVDIGSGGTTQLLLERLLQFPLHGLQLSADDRLRTRFAPDQTEVFLFDGKPAPRLYWAGQPMLERLLSQDVGATLGYCAEKGGIVRVRTARQPAEPRIAQIQSGVRRFAAAWRDSVLNGQPIPPQRAIAPFLRLVECPTALQRELLGDLTGEDGGTYPLAAPQHTAHYLTHPRQARRDFAEARWKIGFLQRAVPLPLPYGKFYLKLKK